jgi:hypothetical protein
MLVGHSGIRSSAHSLRHDMLVRQQAVDGAGGNALLDHPTHAEYVDYRYVRAWFHRERPVQVPRRATERRSMPRGNKLDTVIRLEMDRSIHDVAFAAAKSVITIGGRKLGLSDAQTVPLGCCQARTRYSTRVSRRILQRPIRKALE